MEKKTNILASEKNCNNINLKGLLKDLKSIDVDKLKENKDKIDFYFISKKKTSDGKSIYKAYSPSISKNIQKKVKEITVNRVSEVISAIEEKNYIQDEYNPCGHIDRSIEMCNKTFVKNSQDIISSLKNENQLQNIMCTNDIHTYCFEFKHDNKEIIVLRRFTKMQKLREGFLGTFIEGTFKKINGEVLGVDNDIDLILFDEKILILNHISLERIFDLEEQFKSQARETINMIEEKNIICNFEEFEKDVLNNIPAVKRLTKIASNETLPLFFKNFNRVVEVSKEFGLGITFSDDESQIVYEDKSQITEITLLMNDAYYKTLIGRTPGMDKLK